MNRASQLVSAGIKKTYGKQEVLHGVDLTLEKGKIYGLIGRNGAGKTTLLSILSGQNPASAGQITLNGAPVWENQSALDQICFARELSPVNGFGANALKAKEYLKMAKIYFPNWDQTYAERLVAEFELDTKKRINKMSKGQMSMVTIVVALASGAEYTFLDEPVAGLDVVAREKFYALLLENYAETNRTFVISTHIIEEAANVFEEVIIIDKGMLLLKRNTEELVAEYANVSGHMGEVDAVCEGLCVHHTDLFGRSKSVCASAKAPDTVAAHAAGHEVDVQPVNLQRVFVALCGEEEKK